ncbi:hypothetical protein QO034_13385 [Sedimentitalea sp. JM2-8]|uniref:Uncharacterized protein n=1 Tax=Sedimentitalea xiamensis TaxID=3050037 RepID=A0ABT7FG44_9RHOB|nr:hypothetical protein [Sedimentitalea xiamensis]MDK3074109.1 hypothetical protein [Sedimentitalea xiamensis]
MPKYFITIPNSVTLPTDGNKVALTSACELHRDDSGVPNALTVAAAGAYNMFVADAPGTGTATAPDVTAPILSAPTGAANGATGATTLGVTTDEGNGTLYWGIYPSASTPSAADIVAGTGATVSGSQAVSGTGAQVVADQTGLTASTGYKAHYVHDDAAANRSNVATSATFTTEAAAAYPWDDDFTSDTSANYTSGDGTMVYNGTDDQLEYTLGSAWTGFTTTAITVEDGVSYTVTIEAQMLLGDGGAENPVSSVMGEFIVGTTAGGSNILGSSTDRFLGDGAGAGAVMTLTQTIVASGTAMYITIRSRAGTAGKKFAVHSILVEPA